MKKLFIVATLCLLATAASAQIVNNIDQKSNVELYGSDKIEVAPNEIYISFQIKESDTKGKVSVEDAERKMVAALEKIGVNIKNDLKVSDMSSNFKKYALKSNDIFFEKNYELCVNTTAKAVETFQALEGVGISNAFITRVSHSDIEELRRESKIRAVKSARDAAEQLALAIGQSIGKAINIQDFERNTYRSNAYGGEVAMFSDAVAVKSKAPEIDFEKIKIESNILVKFELK